MHDAHKTSPKQQDHGVSVLHAVTRFSWNLWFTQFPPFSPVSESHSKLYGHPFQRIQSGQPSLYEESLS